MEKIILYGGSFDPVHNGHLRIARAASLLLNADLIFVPSKAPRWKKTSARAVDRVNMLKEALKADGSTNFSLSLVELNKPGTASYTYDTLQEFKALYPKKEFIILMKRMFIMYRETIRTLQKRYAKNITFNVYHT